ncbi:MAG: four helix bundle protein [Vicinamibacterales bacterium]
MPIHSYRDLVVWQKAVLLATDVYRLAREFERQDRFHLRVALGSEAELQTQLEIALRAGVISPPTGNGLVAQASEVGRMLHRLVSAVSKANAPGKGSRP